MLQRYRWPGLGAIVIALVVSACAAPTPAPETPLEATPEAASQMQAAMPEKPTEVMVGPTAAMMDPKPTHATMDETPPVGADAFMAKTPEAMAAPAWFSAQLTNVNTGAAFSVADLNGKVVLVEPMAVWCSNCLLQQRQVQALHGLLGERDDFVSVGLDIDPNETAETLQTYTAQKGFDWYYAVAPREVTRELAALYGDQFLNPPSTPMLIIDQQGEAHVLPFGLKSAEDLQAALEPFLGEAM